MEKGMSSWASTGSSYEVFLSFRGSDTRYGFTDCLYHGMVEAGILVFRDEESLPVGERIGPELLQAIEQSKIYIPIFSRNYASSHWCLQELAHIVKCASKSKEKKEILPIFLDVEPEDVKLKTDLYSQALLNHQTRFSTEVESWRKALIEVDEIKGWNWMKGQGQGVLIQIVIRTVSIKLKVAYENVPEHLVGVDDRVGAIIKKLDVGSEGVKFLGICGIGGIGKTTLAKSIFNKLCSSFDKHCFLADVREQSLRNGLVHWQRQLLSKLAGSHSIHQVHQVNDGINMMNRGVLKNKKVLLVLDNVDEQEQLKSLANEGVFGSGSRIIITTRDQNVLSIVGIATSEGPTEKVANVSLYEVCEMEFTYALQLFSRHAFRRDSPPDDYISISKEIVSTLGKLPLSLEIIGSSLKAKSRSLWEDTLKKLKKAPPKKVQETLMITYERLDDPQKQVFLDITCFFVNQHITSPFHMWDACGYCPHEAIDVLSLMSLIKIKHNTFWMHDQVRDLGRTIVCLENFVDPSKRSRVWNLEEARSVLKRKERSSEIQALSIVNTSGKRFKLELDESAYLPNLRFFEAREVSLAGDFNNLFSGVTWLSCQWPSKFEARNFEPTNLVVLNLSRSDLSEERIGWIGAARKLKSLNLSGCKHLKRTPDLSTLVSLETLILDWCRNLTEIDPSIGKLELLKVLGLDWCKTLHELPEEIGCLQSLTEIRLPKYLRELPETFGNLKSLPILDFSMGLINKLPRSIGGMMKLKVLILRGCEEMKELPYSIGKLQSLIELSLSMTNIGHLPDSIGDLTQLRKLEMQEMKEITYLPSAIWQLKKLVMLDARGCSNLSGEIPEEIKRLSYLEILNLSKTRISGLPPTMGCLPNLMMLSLRGCEEIKELPDSIWKLQSLTELSLSMTDIGHLPDSIGDLTQLRKLEMQDMKGITYLPSAIWRLKKLVKLDASGCSNLSGEIPEEIERLSCLVILDLSETRISGLPPTMSRLPNLQELHINSHEVVQLPELPPSLTILSWCNDAELLTLSQLETPRLASPNVRFLPQLPSCLRTLALGDLATTQSPDFSKLKGLLDLRLVRCSMPEFPRIYDAWMQSLLMRNCTFGRLDAPFQLEMITLTNLRLFFFFFFWSNK